MLRIHLCQIWYNPAYFDGGYDLLEEPAPSLDATANIGQVRQIPSIESYLIESRASYLSHIEKKLLDIIKCSHQRKPNIVVFPEYSVPVEILPKIAALAKQYEIIIIAGTHRVRFTDVTKEVYAQVGIEITKLKNGTSISPVIYPSGIIKVSSKKNHSKWEPNLVVDFDTDDVYEVELEGKIFRFGLAPCIDSLQMDVVGRLLNDQKGRPQAIICPALSPSTTQFKDVGNILASQEVLFCLANSAKFGGTSFNTPSSWLPYLPGVGTCDQKLDTNLEALLEIDFKIDSFFLKKGSTEFSPPCSKVKSFPIVYTSDNLWIESFQKLKNDVIEFLTSNDSVSAIEWIDGFLSEQAIPLPESIVAKLKDLRYGQLITFAGDINSVEETFALCTLNDEIEDTSRFFNRRIKQCIRSGNGCLDLVYRRSHR